MKRIFAVILTVILVAVLAVTALAAPQDRSAPSTDEDRPGPSAEQNRSGPSAKENRSASSAQPSGSAQGLTIDSASNKFMLARDARQTQRADGDVAAVGDDAEVSRGAGGDVFTAGRNVLVADGEALQNVAAAGANVNIHVKKARNIYAAGGDLDVQADDEVKGVYLAGASVTLGGKMTDAYIAALSANISGTVAENLFIRSDNIMFGPDTTVGGKITILSNKHFDLPPSIDPSNVRYRAPGAIGKNSGEGVLGWQAALRKVALVIVVSGIVAATSLSVVLNAMRGGFFRGKADRLRRYFWRDMLRGLASIIVIPVLAFALLVSVIGMPVGAVLLALYAVSIYLAPVIAGLIFGGKVFPRMNKYLSGVIVVCAIWLLMLVPYLGIAVALLSTIYGAGALISAVPPRRFRDRHDYHDHHGNHGHHEHHVHHDEGHGDDTPEHTPAHA